MSEWRVKKGGKNQPSWSNVTKGSQKPNESKQRPKKTTGVADWVDRPKKKKTNHKVYSRPKPGNRVKRPRERFLSNNLRNEDDKKMEKEFWNIMFGEESSEEAGLSEGENEEEDPFEEEF